MGVQVFLNGERLPIKSFQEYVGLYIANKEAPRVYERISDRWEVCVLASEGHSPPGAHALIPLARSQSSHDPICSSVFLASEGQFHQARMLLVTSSWSKAR